MTIPSLAEMRKIASEWRERNLAVHPPNTLEMVALSYGVLALLDRLEKAEAANARAESAFITAMDARNQMTEECIIAPLKERLQAAERVVDAVRAEENALANDSYHEHPPLYKTVQEALAAFDAPSGVKE